MSRHLRSTLLALALVPAVASAQGQLLKSTLYDYRVVPVVEGLVNPWSMAFLPNGDMLVAERPGRLRMVRGGKLVEQPISGTPKVAARGQGGLLDVVLHPAFASNRYVYLSYSKALADTGTLTTTAIGRGRLEGDKLVDFTDIFVAETRGTTGHFGSRLAFDRAGFLFITVGDRMAPPSGNLEAHPAQDLSNHHGKVIRLHDDGRVPSDNPFVGRTGARGEIWSYGHRNMQALVIHPVTGDIWLTEHGPQGGDELNLIKKGANYGWPVIGFGVNYGSGLAIHTGTRKDGMENAVHVWVPSIGVSGMTYYGGDKFPEWKGNLLAGGMSGEQLGRFALNGQAAELAETIVRRQGRIRDVRTGPDGYIYLAIEDRSGKPTPIVRLEPAKR